MPVLVACGMARWLSPSGLLAEFIILTGTCAFICIAAITMLALCRVKEMALRVGYALFTRQAMP